MSIKVYITLGRAKEIAELVKKNCEGLDVAYRDKWIKDRIGKPVFGYYPWFFSRKKTRETYIIKDEDHLFKLEDKWAESTWSSKRYRLSYWSYYNFEKQRNREFERVLEINEPDETLIKVEDSYITHVDVIQEARKEVGLDVYYG